MRYSFLLLSVTLVLFSNCREPLKGKGDVLTEDRVSTPFHRVIFSGAGTLIITKGQQTKVQVKGYENLIPLVKTSVNDDGLIISMKDDFALSNSNIEIIATTPDIRTVTLEGAGEIELKSFSDPYLQVVMSGAGTVRFSESTFDTVIAVLSGAGNMFVNANQYLEATVNGVGSIEYSGDPEVKSTINGMGKVHKK